MLELFFITSNPTKLAHLSYIGRMLGVKITGFRQRTYHASYNEPDSSDRDLVLSRSYESALKQVERAGLPSDALFFFEDTSVNISSLSKNGAEYPGTRIKYWIQENSFDDLNKALGRQGRGASIRSDLVLHLPLRYRVYSKMNVPFFQCSGSVFGRIGRSPSKETAPNLLYPWLDPKSFSGWFVPTGARRVLSDLEIEEADKYDFRLRSFIKIYEFLKSLHLLPSASKANPIQAAFSFAPRRKIVVFLGQTCAGKTTAARVLSDGGAFIHLEASDFMRAELVRRHGPRSGISVRDFATKALSEQPWIVPDQLVDIIRKFDTSNFVISGLRSPGELSLMNEKLLGESIEAIWIDAPSRVRFERSRIRKRSGFSDNYNAFALDDRLQLAMGLINLKRKLKKTSINNVGSIAEFLMEVSRRFASDSPGSWDEKNSVLNDILTPLGRRLILALGSIGGDSEFFTSGQLAQFTSDKKNALFPTEKDNISRFFTQASYPFFELRRQGSGTAVKLSNTGLSLYRVLKHLDREVAL